MTPEERVRMNELCAGIQEEKDYQKFTAMLREMSDLIERKEQRRFPNRPKVVWTRTKPSKTLPAVASKVVGPTSLQHDQKVEILIPAADDLFREIRIENTLTGLDGQSVALTTGAQLTITLEAETSGTVPKGAGSSRT